jgi:hypothetical protein
MRGLRRRSAEVIQESPPQEFLLNFTLPSPAAAQGLICYIYRPLIPSYFCFRDAFHDAPDIREDVRDGMSGRAGDRGRQAPLGAEPNSRRKPDQQPAGPSR